MNDYYVYGYSDPNSCDPYFYIGKGQGNRAYEHLILCLNEQKTPFHKKLKSLLDGGIKPEIEILVNGLVEDEAFRYEIYYISQYGRRDKGGMLLNLTDGGEGISGLKKSEIEILKMKLRGLERKTLSPGSFKPGHIVSDITRNKMSEALKIDKERQKKCHEGQLKAFQKPFAKCNLFSGKIEQIFMNLREVYKYGYNHSSVCNVLKGRQPYSKGYGWRYLTQEEIERLVTNHGNG